MGACSISYRIIQLTVKPGEYNRRDELPGHRASPEGRNEDFGPPQQLRELGVRDVGGGFDAQVRVVLFHAVQHLCTIRGVVHTLFGARQLRT